MAISLGPLITVNCISPGWIDVSSFQKKSKVKDYCLSPIDHSQHPTGRVGVPCDISEFVSYLISPHARFITGQNFVIDGGITKKMIYYSP